MKYTKEQLQAMSDFEVNKALCALLGKDVSGICELRNQMTGAVTDFCNTPSDIMPLAFEHKICLISPHSHTKAWGARQTDGGGLWSVSDYFYLDANPLRAIACCLILVLQGEKE